MNENILSLSILKILLDGKRHSDKQFSQQFNISFNEVNRQIKILKDWGIHIIKIIGTGYKLLYYMELLNENIINETLNTTRLIIIPVVDSTNQYLIQRINTLISGDVCIAEYQKMGRGRRGRSWFSPFGVNIYLSMYWKFKKSAANIMGLSLAISIMVAEVLQEQVGLDIRVKWPNDIYFKNRKVAGILVELTGKPGASSQVIIGIGINIDMHTLNNSIIEQQWSNLTESGMTINRNRLIALIINKIRRALLTFEKEGLKPFIKCWSKLDVFINQPVKLLIGDQEVLGIARGINEKGGLILEQDKLIKYWFGGEISLRPE